uniref:C-mannosyltransferase DPY19L1 n=1 Tax=Trichuris muris TaxID=70415 RepID=A0A5S6QK61_TRIMR
MEQYVTSSSSTSEHIKEEGSACTDSSFSCVTESDDYSETESDHSACEWQDDQSKHVSYYTSTWPCLFVGLLAGITLYYYTYEVHESVTWFSNITPLEKELSLSPESALYYSYYKQLLDAPTYFDGVVALTMDNFTEHPRTKNLLKHLNIHFEAVCASVYRLLRWYIPVDSVSFYIFVGHLCASCSLTVLCYVTYYLSSSLWAEMACIAFFLENLGTCPNIFSRINLWENFLLLMFCVQSWCLCYILRADMHKGSQRILPWLLLFPSALCLCLLRPLGPIALAVQLAALHWLTILDSISIRQFLLASSVCLFASTVIMVTGINGAHWFCLCLICYVWAAFASLALFRCWKRSGDKSFHIHHAFLTTFGQVVFTAVLTFALHRMLRSFFHTDFESFFQELVHYILNRNMPMMEQPPFIKSGIFVYFSELCLAMPSPFQIAFYILLTFIGCFEVGLRADPELSSAEVDSISLVNFKSRLPLSFMLSQSLILVLPAQLFPRLQLAWNSLVALLAACTLGDSRLWSKKMRSPRRYIRWLVAKLLPIAVLAYSLGRSYERYRGVTMSPSEVFEPSKTDLMDWIKMYIPLNASFAGAPDIMAYVKCCTNRRIVAHPCLESDHMADRVRKLFQVCGRGSAAQIHHMLKSYDAQFLIFTSGMCPKQNNPRSSPQIWGSGPTFDEMLLRVADSVRPYFRLVHVNKDYRVYKVL